MSGDLSPAPDLQVVTEMSGISFPNAIPYTHITFCLAAWNEEARLGRLLARVRPYFQTIIVGVQESDDKTLDIARKKADVVVEDQHSGYGDSTFGPKLLPLVKSKWTFKLDADEWPSKDLLQSLSNATWHAEHNDFDGIWIPFRSSVEGIEYKEQHSHLRLFETRLGWPAKLHSRPPTERGVLWPNGYVRHNRSLDEMMRDYLRYWEIGRGDVGWEKHNREMMYYACTGTAGVRGWDLVRSHSWWPEVEAIAFIEEKPWLQSPSNPPRRSRRSRAAAST